MTRPQFSPSLLRHPDGNGYDSSSATASVGKHHAGSTAGSEIRQNSSSGEFGHGAAHKTVGFPDFPDRNRPMKASFFRAFQGPGIITEALNEAVTPSGADVDQSMPEDPRIVLDQLEALHSAQMITPQQPCAALDALIRQAIAGRPGWRQKLAVMTKSPLLRKKILSIAPDGGHGASSSSMLGSSHPWRKDKFADSFSDRTWPAAVASHGFDGRQRQAPVEQRRVDPLLSHSANYSLSKAQRFPGTKPSGEISKMAAHAKGTPGPGHYFHSLPRGVPFPEHGGEGMVFGANHICPWKGALGHNINPVDADQSVLQSAPKFSFSKSRRSVSEPNLGSGPAQGDFVKTDFGVESPGHVYECYSSLRPSMRHSKASTNDTRTRLPALKSHPIPGRRRKLQRVPRVRCIPVDPEPGDDLFCDVASVPEPEPTLKDVAPRV